MRYTFNTPGTLQEAGSMAQSTSPYFWLNSGAYLYIRDGIGQTVQGKLPIGDKWQKLYAAGNARDTNNGQEPQNIFRLVTKEKWLNSDQKCYFRVDRLTMTDSPERMEWSGILLFARYIDGSNLYYAGMRDDGAFVIKKKVGTYSNIKFETDKYQVMLNQQRIRYERLAAPSVMPLLQWFGLRLTVQNQPDNSAKLQLFIDYPKTNTWKLVCEGVDASPLGQGSCGIRTDYRDCSFDNYEVN